MKTLGIIGGLGPMASAYFLELITSLTNAKTDQEHLDIILFSRPNVPDRTQFILDNSNPSPAPSMIETAKTLQGLGAKYICAPCVTSHYIFDEIKANISVPLINMIDETAAALKAKSCKKAGILATSGTIKSQLFQSALKKEGIAHAVPDDHAQEIVMNAIYNEVKAGKAVNINSFKNATENLFSKGCDFIILGCTELSIINKEFELDERHVDALEILAKKCIELCK